MLDTAFWTGLLAVLGVNIILSGDNAVVIAMAARKLQGHQRRMAILLGAAGAVVLRLVFAGIVSFLLEIPFLQVLGGLLLLWIAWKLIYGGQDEGENIKAGEGIWSAVGIIIMADAVMSFDNVIALVGASGGNFVLLALGVATTIPLVVWGASLLSSIMDRFPLLVYAGAGLLVYVAVEMFFADDIVHGYVEPVIYLEELIALTFAAVFLAVAWASVRRRRSLTQTEKATTRVGKEQTAESSDHRPPR